MLFCKNLWHDPADVLAQDLFLFVLKQVASEAIHEEDASEFDVTERNDYDSCFGVLRF